MTKMTTLLNRIFVFVLFLLSCTRVAATRIFPSAQPAPKPPTAKVFALTDAAWLELRAGSVSANQDQGGSKSTDDKKTDDKKKDASPSADDKKDQAKSRECDKSASKSGDSKNAPPSGDDKKKDASKSGDCEGPGGGDGDVGGTGG